jgi:arylsulfatase A-like enzyme
MRRSHRDITNPIVYEAVTKWLDRHGDETFFLFVHMWDCHFDFIPPPPYDTMFDADYDGPITGEGFFFDQRINAQMPRRDLEHLIALYDGEIAWTDHHVGLIADALREMGLLEDTVVVVTSDHGTEFFEHGFKGHRTTLFDEVIRIPLIIRYPKALPAGKRVVAQTRIVDIGPTVLELAGLESSVPAMGSSLVSLMGGERFEFGNLAISELFSVGRDMRTMRSLEWKFTDDRAQRVRYLIDLVEDPAEKRPLFDLSRSPGPEVLAQYDETLGALDTWRRSIAAGGAASEIPEDVMMQLRSLGYVGGTEEGASSAPAGEAR